MGARVYNGAQVSVGGCRCVGVDRCEWSCGCVDFARYLILFSVDSGGCVYCAGCIGRPSVGWCFPGLLYCILQTSVASY